MVMVMTHGSANIWTTELDTKFLPEEAILSSHQLYYYYPWFHCCSSLSKISASIIMGVVILSSHQFYYHYPWFPCSSRSKLSASTIVYKERVLSRY